MKTRRYYPASAKLRPLFLTTAMLFLVQLSKAQIIPPSDRMDYHLSWDGISSILKNDLIYNTTEGDSLVFIFGNPMLGGGSHISSKS